MVMSQSFWIGIIGIGLGLPAVHATGGAGPTASANAQVLLPWWLQLGSVDG